jgi:hypothetical protein
MKFYRGEVSEQDTENSVRDLLLLYDRQPADLRAALQITGEVTRAEVEARLRAHLAAKANECEIYVNEDYQVSVYRHDAPPAEGWPPMVHLSIKRRDRTPFRDWREVQEIKNAILGPECEAVELYPAESRKVDTANQYHLWGFANPELRWPFGFHTGLVADSIEGTTLKQRPLNGNGGAQ